MDKGARGVGTIRSTSMAVRCDTVSPNSICYVYFTIGDYSSAECYMRVSEACRVSFD